MTDIERLEELQTEIHRLEAILKPMYEERKEINKKMNAEHRASLPFVHTYGCYSKGKYEELFLYWNWKTKQYYTKPLYKANGFLYGNKTSKIHIVKKIAELKEDGYVEFS